MKTGYYFILIDLEWEVAHWNGTEWNYKGKIYRHFDTFLSGGIITKRYSYNGYLDARTMKMTQHIDLMEKI
jgi:hypothetical protein